MKRMKSKKTLILPVLAAASLSVSTLAPASNPPSPPNNNGSNSGITNALKDVGNKIVALGFAGMTAYDQAMYQFDQNLLNTLNANTANNTVTQNTPSSATGTNNFIKQSFQNIPDSVLSTGEMAINGKAVMNNIRNQKNLINNLTLGVPASDTLYINNPITLASSYGNTSFNIEKYYGSSQKYTIGPPPMNENNYFSVSSLLEPTAFTPSEANAANAYMIYLTKSYNNPASNLKLSKLKTYLNNLSAAKRPQALYNFISSSEYKKYQLAVRSNMAMKSIAINNFEHLIAERTPSKTAVQGITTPDGSQVITHPSPMQVEQYQALHREANPAWIQSLQSQSSTTLQREIAVELAQIIKQNYQAHQDRERIITALSAMQLEGSAAGQMQMQIIAQQLNQQISSLGGGNSSSSDSSSSKDKSKKGDDDSSKKDKEKNKEQKTKDKQKAAAKSLGIDPGDY